MTIKFNKDKITISFENLNNFLNKHNIYINDEIIEELVHDDYKIIKNKKDIYFCKMIYSEERKAKAINSRLENKKKSKENNFNDNIDIIDIDIKNENKEEKYNSVLSSELKTYECNSFVENDKKDDLRISCENKISQNVSPDDKVIKNSSNFDKNYENSIFPIEDIEEDVNDLDLNDIIDIKDDQINIINKENKAASIVCKMLSFTNENNVKTLKHIYETLNTLDIKQEDVKIEVNWLLILIKKVLEDDNDCDLEEYEKKYYENQKYQQQLLSNLTS